MSLLTTGKRKARKSDHLIVLDAGHGGHDPGALGPSGTRESDVALDITRVTAHWLRQYGFRVLLTRDEDTFLSLNKRAAIANEAKADAFISIHCNSAKVPAHGTETFILRGSKVAYPLAEEIQDGMLEMEPLRDNRDRGVKRARYKVLRLTKMPAALVETQFIHVPCGEKQLLEKQWAFGKGIANGITRALGYSVGAKKLPTEPDEPQPCPCIPLADAVETHVTKLSETLAAYRSSTQPEA